MLGRVFHIDVAHYCSENDQATQEPESRLDIEFATKSAPGNNATADRTTDHEDEDEISIDAVYYYGPLTIDIDEQSVPQCPRYGWVSNAPFVLPGGIERWQIFRRLEWWKPVSDRSGITTSED